MTTMNQPDGIAAPTLAALAQGSNGQDVQSILSVLQAINTLASQNPPPPKVRSLTLREAFMKYVFPEMKKTTTRGTQSDNLRYLAVWEEFELLPSPVNHRTPGPVSCLRGPILLDAISTRDVTEFRDWVTASGEDGGLGLSTSWANKAVKLIRRIVRESSDEHDVRRIATKTLPTESAGKHRMGFEELTKLWRVVEDYPWPSPTKFYRFAGSDMPASTFWRSILIIASAYGMRVQDLARYSSRGKPSHYSARRFNSVTWADITFEEVNPNPDGQCKNAFGWFTYCASKTGRDYWLPITKPVRAALDRLAVAAAEATGSASSDPRSLPQDREILPTPRGHGVTDHWRKLQEKAGVVAPNGEIYELNRFRKLAASALLPVHADLPYIVCGWSTARSDVAMKHYLESEETLVKFMPQVPYPNCFREWTGEAMPDSTETPEDQA